MNVLGNTFKNKATILIVEDSPTQAEQLRHILEQHGYNTEVANNGNQALVLLGERNPELVIADIVMPEMQGYELCKRIKSDKNKRDIPVILLTSLTSTEDVLHGLACGADSFITKPYNEDYLISRIESLLKGNTLGASARQKISIEVILDGKKCLIETEYQQMLNLLISSYEAAMSKNTDLVKTQDSLKLMNDQLEELVKERTAKLTAEIAQRRQVEIDLKKTEKHIIDQNILLSSIINGQKDTLAFSLDKKYRYTTFNENHCREMKKVHNADIKIGQCMLDYINITEVKHIAKASYDRVLKGESFTEEQQQPGLGIWYEFNWNPVRFAEEEIVGISVFVRDITQRKQAEKALEKSAKEWQETFDSAKDMITLISPEFRFLKVNKAACKSFGKTQEEILGKKCYEIVHGTDSPIKTCPCIATVEKGLKDETEIEEHGRNYIVTASPVFDDNNELKSFVHIVRDITESKFAKENMKSAETRFRELFDNMSNGVSVYEAKDGGNDFIFKEFNHAAEKIDKTKRTDVIGKSVADIFPGVIKCGIFEAFKRVWKTNKSEHLEEFWYEDNRISGWRDNYVYKLPSGEVVAIYEDTTQKRQYYDTQLAIKSLLSLALEDITINDFLKQSLDMLFSLHRFSFEKKGAIFLKEGNSDTLIMAVQKEMPAALQKACSRVKFGKCLCGRAASTKKIVFASCVDERHETQIEGMKPHGHYCVPILSSDRVLGVMNIYLKEGYKYNKEDEDFLTSIANTLAGVIERKQGEEKLKNSYEKLRRTLEETSSALASALEKRDQYTAGHQNRVSHLACAIAKEMGMTEEQIEGVRIAGILHDIGKLNIPAEILSKPGKLSDLEFSFIKTHSQSGYDILKDIEFPWPIAKMVLQHHERVNGSGYPLGLSGDNILLEAKILAVADVVEAMASHRPYRAALGIDKALLEITQNKGKIYDPNTVDACLKVFRDKIFKFN